MVPGGGRATSSSEVASAAASGRSLRRRVQEHLNTLVGCVDRHQVKLAVAVHAGERPCRTVEEESIWRQCAVAVVEEHARAAAVGKNDIHLAVTVEIAGRYHA